jgi:hypothetical protein
LQDEEKEKTQTKLRRVSLEEIKKASEEEKQQREIQEKLKKKVFVNRGFAMDSMLSMDDQF